MASPDPLGDDILKAAEVPYEFDVLRPNYGTDLPTIKGGPVSGAIIVVTPDLAAAA